MQGPAQGGHYFALQEQGGPTQDLPKLHAPHPPETRARIWYLRCGTGDLTISTQQYTFTAIYNILIASLSF